MCKGNVSDLGIVFVDSPGEISDHDFEEYWASILKDRRDRIRDQYMKKVLNPEYYGTITILAGDK